ncbi:MAG: hypothetical protein A2600_04195 [Candidatus Lambdaproteobacteria bacterium RIFOXYD1_FULL_56_27]|uniref:Uncharacterized protein n=1 Tax=Candidatus Lambdaproteobacteria bacterium RIFOXYD2_FULL_56_26 TaxID=1817773 RepID=A0A1F6H3J2_9PROT|nr:MAG: hypothetical protein A2426_01995 [Candidatus Lambdaproteobacteria bacterium RIFOXYC1_FULL_56_13]OGH04957.1 MAG: hypothetical protein A2557_08260 [Candidatus Lambdaproteobacteria bacterium RIFOXYD2_FULL_56_26]OGH09422.1 MAG: hypothetical protein A2600_04195 [Candidatus Lambdaproteobacteria bacterium RIFOXYD1_FULL_56_27]
MVATPHERKAWVFVVTIEEPEVSHQASLYGCAQVEQATDLDLFLLLKQCCLLVLLRIVHKKQNHSGKQRSQQAPDITAKTSPIFLSIRQLSKKIAVVKS